MSRIIAKLVRRHPRGSARTAFESMSREDQVAYLDNQRGADGLTGVRDQTKATPPPPWSGQVG